MQKKHLFRLVILLGSLPWLQLFGIAFGFEWLCWMIVINIILQLLYSYCLDDEKDKYNPSNFQN
jgi:hypothetical protein